MEMNSKIFSWNNISYRFKHWNHSSCSCKKLKLKKKQKEEEAKKKKKQQKKKTKKEKKKARIDAFLKLFLTKKIYYVISR